MDKNKKLIGMLLRWIYGLSWLVFPFGIVVLAIEHEKMTKEEKQYMVSIFVTAAIEAIIYTVGSIFGLIFSFNETAAFIVYIIFTVLEGAIGILMLVAAILCMLENFWKVPVVYDLAGKFLPNEEPKKTDVVDAEVVSESKDKE